MTSQRPGGIVDGSAARSFSALAENVETVSFRSAINVANTLAFTAVRLDNLGQCQVFRLC